MKTLKILVIQHAIPSSKTITFALLMGKRSYLEVILVNFVDCQYVFFLKKVYCIYLKYRGRERE